MRSMMRVLLAATAAFVAAVVLYAVFTTPPASLQLGGTISPTQIPGAYHVHTARSDGTGTVDEIAAAASRAGLKFVVFTDHGDGTRPPDPPAYRHGVLCLDAVEVSTSDGHIVALGLTEASPYPLAGNAADVIEDVHRAGGVAIAAHPDSPNSELRWRGQLNALDGIEWLNVDSEWRDDRPSTLLMTALRSFVRGPESIAGLFDRPVRTFSRWDMAARTRPMFGLAALDAHARIGWRDRQEPRDRTALAWPSYERIFHTAAQVAILDAPLTGRAESDAPRLVGALRNGHSFSIVRAFADGATLQFAAERGTTRTEMGARVEPGDLTFRASVPEAPGARVTLYANGRRIGSGSGSLFRAGPTSPGSYRIEVTLPGSTMPWIVSNPILVAPAVAAEGPVPAAMLPSLLMLPSAADAWAIEKDATSTGAVERDGAALRFSYRLGAGVPRGQYAAVAGAVPPDAAVDQIRFVARATRPMRLSVQLRRQGGEAERWRRSVFVDTTPRPITVSLQEFDPVGDASTMRPIVTRLQALLFVVDTLNSLTGTEGTVWISDVGVGVQSP